MKTTFTTQHNAASTLNGSHAAHNVYSPLRRLTLLVTLLMTFALGVKAEKYVIYNGTYFLAIKNKNSIEATTTFNPATCIWTGPENGASGYFSIEYNGSTYYLNKDYNSYTLSVSTSASSSWNVKGSMICTSVYSSIVGTTYYYLYYDYESYYNPGWKTQRQENDPSNNILYLCSVESSTGGEKTKSYAISIGNVVANPTTLDHKGTSTVTVSGGSVTITTTTTSGDNKYTLTPNSRNGDPVVIYSNSSTPVTTTETKKPTGYSWTLSSTDNASLNNSTTATTTNTVTYNTASATDTQVTVEVRALYTVDETTHQSDAVSTTITLNRVLSNPTSITAEDLTLAVGTDDDISYTLTGTAPIYDKVEATSSNTGIFTVVTSPTNGGKVTLHPVAMGNATLTLIAKAKDGTTNACSTTVNITVAERVKTPIITYVLGATNTTVTITSETEGTAIYYTIDGSNPTTTSSAYEGPFTVATSSLPLTIKAIATKADYIESEVAERLLSKGNGTANDPYIISSASDLDNLATYSSAYFKVVNDFDVLGSTGSITNFSGTLDGNYKVIKGLRRPLFTSVNGATIKNVVLDDVQLTSSVTTNKITCLGAIAAYAAGNTKIYNCGILSKEGVSSISGGDHTGSLVGYIVGNTRVVNNYSYANVSGGQYVGGIVGYNATASTSSNLATIVMNCMYYGNITGGTDKAPIYNGKIITNVSSTNNTGINNYNYYRYSSAYSLNGQINTYNCALAAEERYLVRHEFYRGILNSNKDLCGWYVTGQTNQPEIIGKWVLDTSIAPYPIIKPQGRYRGLVNRFITHEDASSLSTEEREGRILSDEGDGGYLTVTVERGGNGSGSTSITLRLPITDMNYNTYDYNYAKVVLPFYNQYFGGNYTNNKVVTGWEITSITEGGVETTGTNAYNYADRNSEGKDKGRIFAQGGYYNVPKGVKPITIKAKWADAVYLSDEYYDKSGYNLTNLTVTGRRYTNNTKYSINGSSQTVYTSLANAITNLTQGATVYDKAIVLVGNYHSYGETWSSGNKPFTLMSADLDNDNEPDYCVFHYHNDRININPVRFDFLWHPGIGMAHKANEATNMLNQGIFHPTGWFEITETALARYTEFEYGYGDNAPVILNNGIFEQFVTRHDNTETKKQYIIVGGNLYMKQFSPGVHVDNTGSTRHCPVNVLGGEYESFYLSGMFRPDAGVYNDVDVMCYTNGGKFGVMAGAGHEKINGNMWFKINHSIIDEFYGGGINASKPITGNINIQIDNSFVEKFCGGPMFGSMQDGKTVTTNADGTTFGLYYGAGNGGTSLNRQPTDGKGSGSVDYGWGNWMSTYYNSLAYNTNLGIQVQPEYEYFAYAGGGDANGGRNVGRFYVNYAKFDKAQTNTVSSTLTNCTVLNDYYGGGNLGYVNGDVTSVLDGCTVKGSVYGGGFSATIPTVWVYPNGFVTEPSYNRNVGVYNKGVFGTPKEYTWSRKQGLGSNNITDEDEMLIWSDVELANLGEVSGNTYVTIKGNSHIDGGVYGGGNESKVVGETKVEISATDGSSMISNVFGGANKADVGGNTTVNIKSGKIGNVFGANNLSGTKSNGITVNVTGGTSNYVYGAGNLAAYAGSPIVNLSNGIVKEAVYGGGLGASAIVTGNPQVRMTGGVVGYTEKVGEADVVRGGEVFGGGNAAEVKGNTSVTLTGGEVKHNVYGGGNQAAVSGTTNVTIGQQ